MLPEGGASINLKWSDLDVDHKLEGSERIIAELLKAPGYQWLIPLIDPYLIDKYCNKCIFGIDGDECQREQTLKFFPYCFKEVKG